MCCRYFMMKQQILESMGLGVQEAFPVFADRMPVQLLAFLRLSRIADPALFAKVGCKSHPLFLYYRMLSVGVDAGCFNALV